MATATAHERTHEEGGAGGIMVGTSAPSYDVFSVKCTSSPGCC